MTDLIQQAFSLAEEARKNSYAPYSGFKVGAVVKAKGSDKLYAGGNVENSVNGASVCAEITAISQMITKEGKKELDWVLVVSEQEDPLTPPCGVCRQFMFEFSNDENMPIYIYSLSGKHKKTTMGELLPMAFKGKDIILKK